MGGLAVAVAHQRDHGEGAPGPGVGQQVNVVVGGALTVVSFGFLGGGVDSLPGLVLVGAGAAQLGVPQ